MVGPHRPRSRICRGRPRKSRHLPEPQPSQLPPTDEVSLALDAQRPYAWPPSRHEQIRPEVLPSPIPPFHPRVLFGERPSSLCQSRSLLRSARAGLVQAGDNCVPIGIRRATGYQRSTIVSLRRSAKADAARVRRSGRHRDAFGDASSTRQGRPETRSQQREPKHTRSYSGFAPSEDR